MEVAAEGRGPRVGEDGRTELGVGEVERGVDRVAGPDVGREDGRPAFDDRPVALGPEGRLLDGRLTELRLPPLVPPEPALPFP